MKNNNTKTPATRTENTLDGIRNKMVKTYSIQSQTIRSYFLLRKISKLLETWLYAINFKGYD